MRWSTVTRTWFLLILVVVMLFAIPVSSRLASNQVAPMNQTDFQFAVHLRSRLGQFEAVTANETTMHLKNVVRHNSVDDINRVNAILSTQTATQADVQSVRADDDYLGNPAIACSPISQDDLTMLAQLNGTEWQQRFSQVVQLNAASAYRAAELEQQLGVNSAVKSLSKTIQKQTHDQLLLAIQTG